jgi:peptide/nickel transport system permease protein
MELAAAALVLAVVLGGILGLLTGRGGGTTLRVGLVASASVPGFLLALLLLMVFYPKLRWFPESGRISPDLNAPTGPPVAHHRRDARRPPRRRARCAGPSGVPALCLALGPAVALERTLRSSLQTVLLSDHIRAARANGITEHGVLLRHGIRPALNAP